MARWCPLNSTDYRKGKRDLFRSMWAAPLSDFLLNSSDPGEQGWGQSPSGCESIFSKHLRAGRPASHRNVLQWGRKTQNHKDVDKTSSVFLPSSRPLTTGKNGRNSRPPTGIEWVPLLPHTPINWMNGWMYNKVNPIGKEFMNHIHFTKSRHTKGRANTRKVEARRVPNRCPTLKPFLVGYLYWSPRLGAHPPPHVFF